MASRSRLRLWRQKRRRPLRPWDAAPRVRLSATRNTSRIGPSTRSLPSTYAWPSFIRSGGSRKRSADGLGTPILTLGSLARSKARPFHNSRRSGMAADRLSFAISLSRRCSRNMSFHRRGKHHSIAGRRASYTIEQAWLHSAGGRHESFHGSGIRSPVFARFVGAIPVAADQADRANSAGGRPRYFGAGHRTEALRAGRSAGGGGKPPGLQRQYRDGPCCKVSAGWLHARAARRQHG